MNLVFLLYIMLFSVCDRCDILWCRQKLMNLVFLLYIMLFSVCDRCDIFVVPSGADESSIFIVYYVILSL